MIADKVAGLSAIMQVLNALTSTDAAIMQVLNASGDR
jgi:hypothetical protein